MVAVTLGLTQFVVSTSTFPPLVTFNFGKNVKVPEV